MDLNKLKQLNKERWEKVRIWNSQGPAFEKVSDRLKANKDRYETVEKATGVPWWFVAVVHVREASEDWDAQLAQGDPLDRPSVHKPKNRGPFKTWEEGAYDALVNCHPYAAKNKDWSPAGALTLLEQYNGLGYAMKGKPSPYLWARTNQYTKGKYIADGVWDPDHVDKQLGCAGLLKFMGVFNNMPTLPFPLNVAFKLISPDKVGSWVRGGVAAGLTVLVGAVATQVPFITQFVSPDVIQYVAALAGTAVAGYLGGVSKSDKVTDLVSTTTTDPKLDHSRKD